MSENVDVKVYIFFANNLYLIFLIYTNIVNFTLNHQKTDLIIIVYKITGKIGEIALNLNYKSFEI